MEIENTIIGGFIILGLPTKKKFDPIIDGLKTLSGIFALSFRYSMLYTDMEKQVQEQTRALTKSREKFKYLFEYSPLGKSITGIDGSKKVNKAFSDILGYSVEELISKTWQETTHPDDIQLSIDAMQPLLEGKTTMVRFKKRYIHKNCSIVWADVVTYLKRDKNNEPEYFITTIKDITQEKKAEMIILEDKNRLSSIYETVGDIMFYIEVEAQGIYRFISVNSAFLNATGLKREMVEGKKASEIIPEPSLSLALKHYEKAIKEKKIVRWEETTEYPTGVKVGDVSISPIFNAEGKCTHLVGSVHDITNRKKAQEKIERFSRIFEDSLNEIYLFDAENLKFVQVNNAAQKNLDYTMDELKLLTPLNIKPNFTRESFGELVAPLRKGEKSNIIFETVHQRKDKSLYDVEVHLQLLRFERETLFAAIIMDITERKKADEEIKSKEKQFRTLIESAGDAMFLADFETNQIILVNNQACINLGYDKEELLSKKVSDLDPYFVPNKHHENIWGKMIPGQIQTLEVVHQRKDGSRFPVEIRTGLITFNGKKAILGFARDVSERKQMEEELKKHHEKLEHLVKERTKELELKNKELNNAMKVFVGRELKITELQNKLNAMED
jgi:PAS domain S-box-containing protein